MSGELAPLADDAATINALRAELQAHSEVIARILWLHNHGHLIVLVHEQDGVTGRPDPAVADCMRALDQARELVKRKMWREYGEKAQAAARDDNVLNVLAVEVKDADPS